MILKVGIIGSSSGNGHPYSWSAICNNYSKEKILKCGYPTIPLYLEKEQWPESKIQDVEITHIWTQDYKNSKQIAEATFISNIVSKPRDMINRVDAILLARDDAVNHYELAEDFIKAGIPIFIDKPIALDMKSLNRLLEIEKFPGQIFSCSALIFSKTINLDNKLINKIGNIKLIKGTCPKLWQTYSIHLIDPLVKFLNLSEYPQKTFHQKFGNNGDILSVKFKNELNVLFTCLGEGLKSDIKFDIYGDNGNEIQIFNDPFYSFKSALNHFFNMVKKNKFEINHKRYKQSVRIIEMFQNN